MKVENRAEKQNMTGKGIARLVCADSGEISEAEREILVEHRLELVVNEQTMARLVCTPGDLEEFVVGRLITERVISDVSEIEQMYLCDSGNRARVFLKENIRLRAAQTEEPTCCTDNRIFLQSVETAGQKPLAPAMWKREWIFSIVNAFAEDSKLHRSTGGTHCSMLAVEDQVLYRAEDLGRHNALDKAIGYAALQGLNRDKCILFTTGRVPTDMVRKVLAAGIPVLVSKAVPTGEAVAMAREYGLTLICRAWPDSFEVYAGDL